MTSLIRWEPFREVAGIRNEMERLFDDFFRGRRDSEEESLQATWVPAVDIHESDAAITLRAELPGLNKDDVELVVENNQLIIKGEKKLFKEEGAGQYRRVESRYGAFYRGFPLPNVVDQESVDARFENGVLEVILPKVEAAKPRRIQLKVH